MKKVYKMQDLDCANCAAKMERAIAALPGVEHVTINFMTQRMTLEAADADFERLLSDAQKAIRKIEPDCTIVR